MASSRTDQRDMEAIQGLRSHYRSGNDDLADDFFQPCMARCSAYSRAVGFFTSSSLVTWASALPRFVRYPELRIRLLISPQLTEEDRQALRKTQDADQRGRLLQEVGDRVVEYALEFAKDPSRSELRIKLLLWLIATERLRLKFAFPDHTNVPGMYHEKIGVFEFPWGDRVAFTGSANETRSGHSFNYESVDVYRSWVEGDEQRVQQKVDQFEEAWDGRARGMTTVPPSEDVLDRVGTLAPERRPVTAEDKGDKGNVEDEPDPWRHQDEAVEVFLEEKQGILEMATGTGKTRTALKIMRRLLGRGEIDTVVVSTDGTDLLEQWEETLLKFVGGVSRSMSLYRHFGRHHERELFVRNPAESIFLSSRQALAPGLRNVDTEILGRTLLIHDEVQGLGSPAKREELNGLTDPIPYRLGLSATPEREYDEEGTEFIKRHVGPVIYEFDLADAIRRGILVPFDYHPLSYVPSEDDKKRLANVFKKKAAREAEGNPMSKEELWIELARVHKTSEAKLPVFRDFLEENPELLERCLIFVETREYGEKVLEIVHDFRYDFHTYFAAEESAVLERFAQGELECLLTCHRLSEGIDIQNLRTVVLFASAKSRLETIQRIGRCLRSDPEQEDKRAHVVDFIREDDGDQPNPDQQRREWLSSLAEVEPER